MKNRLPRKFYTRPTLKVAKHLLGKYLVRKIGSRKLVGKIVETEAYIGPQDKASHAYNYKKTKRNRAEWLIGGHIYIYLVYGMYWQLNVSTSQEGEPECVLIRALEPIILPKIKSQKSKVKNTIQNLKLLKNLTNGPGKLCRWMKLDKSFYGEDLTKSKRIWLETGEKIRPNHIVASKRIGIDYAKEWADKPWRFYIKNNKFVSGR